MPLRYITHDKVPFLGLGLLVTVFLLMVRSHICECRRMTTTRVWAAVLLTPANGQVNVEVLPLAEHGDDQQAVQVDALHQQPIVVGHHAVLHHHHGSTAPRHSLTDDTEAGVVRMQTMSQGYSVTSLKLQNKSKKCCFKSELCSGLGCILLQLTQIASASHLSTIQCSNWLTTAVQRSRIATLHKSSLSFTATEVIIKPKYNPNVSSTLAQKQWITVAVHLIIFCNQILISD